MTGASCASATSASAGWSLDHYELVMIDEAGHLLRAERTIDVVCLHESEAYQGVAESVAIGVHRLDRDFQLLAVEHAAGDEELTKALGSDVRGDERRLTVFEEDVLAGVAPLQHEQTGGARSVEAMKDLEKRVLAQITGVGR